MFGTLDKYIVAFLTGLVVTFVLTPMVRAVAARLGIVDLPSERRPHKRATARGGGLAVVLGVHAACLFAMLLPHRFVAGLDFHWYCYYGGASLILLVVGLIDDVRGMLPWTKLAGQTLAASLMCLSGTRFGRLFGIELPPALDVALAVFWIVAVINAFNLIDGLDGLASGLAIISAIGLSGIFVIGQTHGEMLVLVALTGACLAFLRYNFHPASIFLGDTGSMFLGFTLGVISLQTFTKSTFILSLTIPMLVLGVPIYDALLAIWRRSVRRLLQNGLVNHTGKRAGIMQADMEHLHHRLLKAGLSTSRVATLLCVLNAGLVFFGLLMTLFQSHAAGIFLLALLAGAYVLMRHLAVIELRDTGRALLNGLRQPTHATLKSLSYPLWDMFCLAGSVAVAMRLFDPPSEDFWHAWFLDLPVWVTPALSLLAISRTYVTIWTRPRLLDVLLLAFTLQVGLLLSLGMAWLIDPTTLHQSLVRAFIVGGISNPAIIGLRVVYRVVEELVNYCRGKSETGADGRRVLLYGAGNRCQLFLKERGFHNSSSIDDRNIIGLIDDEPALRSQWVYGSQVLGGINELPQVVARHKITGIIITATLRPESMVALKHLAQERELHLSEWHFHEGEPGKQAVETRLTYPVVA
jgi:UDP-N-acetylmuramyl pentapeptide phosphotransferase/UDP-N-acetylglucosamine-1-phosphate transferase